MGGEGGRRGGRGEGVRGVRGEGRRGRENDNLNGLSQMLPNTTLKSQDKGNLMHSISQAI